MMLALYGTIWIALVLFVVAEAGRSVTSSQSAERWAWRAFTAGSLLAILHALLAFAIVHGWNHADAVASTARQTESIYGIAFGSGLYVNYLFLSVWFADVWWWRYAPRTHVRPASVVWTLRAFYMLIIFNAAVVFSSGLRRGVGLVIVFALASVWTIELIEARSAQRQRLPADRTAFR